MAVNRVYELLQFVDDLVPQHLYIPSVVTRAARYMSDTCTPPSFPYKIDNVDLSNVLFWEAAIIIFLQPFIWNCIARLEYYTRILSKVFIKPIIGVYVLALWIFVAGLYRDALFVEAMKNQDTVNYMDSILYRGFGFSCITLGMVLVFSSFYQLGVTGTFLGDYFGMLMSERVTAFPFNVFEHPMYDGSTLAFLGKAVL